MGQEYWEGHVAKWSSGHSAISENTKRDFLYRGSQTQTVFNPWKIRFCITFVSQMKLQLAHNRPMKLLTFLRT